MLKIFLITLMFFQSSTSCGRPVAPDEPLKASGDKNVNAPVPQPTPVEQIVSECTRKRAVGLPANISIPQELCFDASKPVDAKERSSAKVGNSPQSATIELFETPFEKLPAEVQRIIKITAPEMDTSAVEFSMTVIPTADERANNRLVKSYSYTSSSKVKAPGKDVNNHTWLFKRQGNLLKLEFAEIDTTK